jgi:hypothetical protein
MADTFAELYGQHSKDIFIERAQQQLAQGSDGLICAQNYAERGKPDFALAYLLLIEAPDEVKRDILAHSYEQRARISEEKADALNRQFHRPFPLIKVEAQKDRAAAQQIRQGRRIHRDVNVRIVLN